jgi:hypothetical protein
MTMIGDSLKKCSVCGMTSKQPYLNSISASGAPDLDTRPPDPKRSTFKVFGQRCPFCGYCARDLVDRSRSASRVVNHPTYRRQLENRINPELVNTFICQAIIFRADSEMESSAWALIWANWACDDEGTPEQSVECRRVASDFIMKFRHTFSAPGDVVTAITVDLFRRAGKFKDALALISDNEASVQEELFQKVLQYQKILIEKRDMERHTIEEAVQANSI